MLLFNHIRLDSSVRPSRGIFYSLALFSWSATLLGIAVYTYFNPDNHTVYPDYSNAAKNWWLRQNIYDNIHYRYSPLFAIAMTPFAILPEPIGGVLWKLFNALFYATGLWAWGRKVLPENLDTERVAIFFLLALPTSLISIYNGQANLFMLGALLWGVACAVGRRWLLAGSWLAVATLVKAYPLALAMLLMALYPLQFTVPFVVALGAGLSLPLLIGPQPYSFAQSSLWLEILFNTAGVRPEKYRSFDQLWRIYYEPMSPYAYMALEVLAGAAVLGLCLWQARQGLDRRALMTSVFAWFACWVLLFGPTTEEATYAVITPAIAWSLLEVFGRPNSRRARCLLLASMAMMGPLATDLFGTAARVFATMKGCLPVGALVYLGYLLARELGKMREREAVVG